MTNFNLHKKFDVIIFVMKFLLVKVPHNNEYTYEQGLAFISSLVSRSKNPNFFLNAFL